MFPEEEAEPGIDPFKPCIEANFFHVSEVTGSVVSMNWSFFARLTCRSLLKIEFVYSGETDHF
jgi:hypothetical protein